ncbi:MAG: putative peptidoglycan glycosyltransferase FtsW [bacterium]|nr:putative peptidoglycan glycosyltransferase FtsW [bacterium]
MKKTIDYVLLALILGLVFFGLSMIASVSVYESYNKFQQNDFYFWRRMGQVAYSLVGFGICLVIPYRFWEKISLPVLIGAVAMLFLVFTNLGGDYGSANSWLDIPFLPSIQPVEFAKFGLIIYLSHWMSKNRQDIKHFHYGFIPFLIISCVVAIPIALQPDFGSLLVIMLTAVAIFLVAGGSFFQVGSGGLIASVIGLFIALNVDYIYNRFVTFFNPDLDTLGISYQIKNSLTAIGSGGLFGLGFGQSIQKNGYLPEVQGDTIFAAIGEEMGFVRTALIILVFAVIAWRCYSIARNSKDWFAKLIVVGFTTSITVQMLINVSVSMALFPNTGITLPFISYGGTSLLVCMMMMGIILNISRSGTQPADYDRKQRTRSVRMGKKRVGKYQYV